MSIMARRMVQNMINSREIEEMNYEISDMELIMQMEREISDNFMGFLNMDSNIMLPLHLQSV